MLQTKNPEVERIIQKYGEGFDTIYFDGKADGKLENKLEIARNLLNDGFDEKVISRNTGIPLDKLNEIKKD